MGIPIVSEWLKRLAVCLALAGIYCLGVQQSTRAFYQSRDSNYNISISAGGGGGCSQATTFLARTSLGGSYPAAYTTLICDLVTAGLITGNMSTTGCGSTFDVFYVLASDTSADALLNLCSTSYGGTLNGAPTFTAANGFTGVSGSSTVSISSGFTPSTATSPNYTQNSAHISSWVNTNITAGLFYSLGSQNTSTSQSGILPRYSDGNAYYRINDANASPSAGTATANSIGHYVATRSSSTTGVGYKNAANQTIGAATSAGVSSFPYLVLANNTNGGANGGIAAQIMMVTLGGALTSGNVTTLCHEENLYLTTIAGLSAGTC
jgi:hypothetical protein